MTDRLATLGRLTGDPDEFAAAYWGRRPLLAEGRGPFDDLLTIAAADRLLATGLRTPGLRMVHDGGVIDPKRYCTTVRLGGQPLADVADPRKVAGLLADGATLVLQSLHRLCEPVGRFADSLMAEIGHPVQVNAYLTPPAEAGLGKHADEHDVFAVQIAGSKHWWVDGLGDVLVSPGDVLYVPAGCRHAARTGRATSLHLTIGMLRVTYRQVLDRLLRSANFDALDAPLPLGYRSGGGDRDLATELTEILRQVSAEIGRADGAAIALGEQRRPLAPFTRAGLLESVVGLADLGADTVIRWAAEPPAFTALDDDGGRSWVRVAWGASALRLPAEGRPAIEFAAAAEAVRVGDLPGLDAASRAVVARRLVREGACVIVR